MIICCHIIIWKKYLKTGRIWDDRAELEYTDEGAVYEFKFEKNKLKLYLME